MTFLRCPRSVSVPRVLAGLLVVSLLWYVQQQATNVTPVQQTQVGPTPAAVRTVDEDVLDWAKSNKLSPVVVGVLAKEGYTSLDAISLMTADDIVQINAKPTLKGATIPRGQQRLLIRAAQQLAEKWRDGSTDLLQQPKGEAIPDPPPEEHPSLQKDAPIAEGPKKPAPEPASLQTETFKYLEKAIVRTGETKFLDTHVNYTYLDWKRPEDSDLPGVQEMVLHKLKTMRQTMNNTKQTYIGEGVPKECATKNFGDLSQLPKASIHITFHDGESLLNVAHTLHSIFLTSPHELVQEIILIDDYSVKEELKELLQNYVDAVFGRHVTTFRVVRSNTKLGAIRTRLLAARLAKADVFVIMDSHMEFRPFWLESLLYEIKLNRKTLATSCLDWMKPHEDGTWTYEHGGSKFRGVFDWDMSFGYYTRHVPADRDPTEPMIVPFQLGGALAIDREFFFEVGGFDEGMGAWGGENIDLSLKVFLCGGRVIQVPCSHVAHLEAPGQRNYRAGADWMDSLKRNNKRIAKTFFGPYEKYIYIFNKGLQDVDPGDMSARLAQFQKCSVNFSTYLNNFYPEMGDPEVDALAYGQVQNMKYKERCLDRAAIADGKVGICHHLGTPQALIYSAQGYLRTGHAIMHIDGNSPNMINYPATSLLDPNYEPTRFIHWKDGLMKVEKTEKCLEVSDTFQLITNADCNPTNQAQLWTLDTYTDIYHAFLRGEYIEKSSLSSPEAGQRFYKKYIDIVLPAAKPNNP